MSRAWVVEPVTKSVTVTLPVITIAEKLAVDETGASVVMPVPKCLHCRKPIGEAPDGEPALWLGSSGGFHLRCVQDGFAGMSEHRAWLVLAEAVARCPHRYSASTIRAVLRNVTRLAPVAPDDPALRIGEDPA